MEPTAEAAAAPLLPADWWCDHPIPRGNAESDQCICMVEDINTGLIEIWRNILVTDATIRFAEHQTNTPMDAFLLQGLNIMANGFDGSEEDYWKDTMAYDIFATRMLKLAAEKPVTEEDMSKTQLLIEWMEAEEAVVEEADRDVVVYGIPTHFLNPIPEEEPIPNCNCGRVGAVFKLNDALIAEFRSYQAYSATIKLKSRR